MLWSYSSHRSSMPLVALRWPYSFLCSIDHSHNRNRAGGGNELWCASNSLGFWFTGYAGSRAAGIRHGRSDDGAGQTGGDVPSVDGGQCHVSSFLRGVFQPLLSSNGRGAESPSTSSILPLQ